MSASVSIVTAPLRASSLPDIVTPVVVVMEVNARIFPMKVEVVPSVAEVPTCQKTFAACALFIAATMLAFAVVSEVPI